MTGKKSFDREKMYKKIMPGYESQADDTDSDAKKPSVDAADLNELASMSGEAFLVNSDIQKLNQEENKFFVCNITERKVTAKLDMVLQKMECCKCTRCKMEILAQALNQLTPNYMVGTKNTLSALSDADCMNQEITTALLRAVIQVRKNPPH